MGGGGGGGCGRDNVLARRRVLRQYETTADGGVGTDGRPQTAQGVIPSSSNKEDFSSKVRRTQSFSSIPIHYQVSK